MHVGGVLAGVIGLVVGTCFVSRLVARSIGCLLYVICFYCSHVFCIWTVGVSIDKLRVRLFF